MLKWTITKRTDTNPYHVRRSLGALQTTRQQTVTPTNTNSRQIRRSIATVSGKDIELNKDKENRYTSTPCVNPLKNHALVSNSDESVINTVALRDLSNITPNTTPKNKNKRAFLNTPVMTSTIKKRNKNAHYSSTLPTFDVEYSPCEIKGTPFAAISSVGDSYYENARYFRDDIKVALKEPNKNAEEEIQETYENRFSFKKPCNLVQSQPAPTLNTNLDDSLHSSQMGDITLDKMIDAILESARKERPKRSASVKSKDSKCSIECSPTYTPADDPANDLLKYEENLELSPNIKYLNATDKTIILNDIVTNEREVKTPDSSNIKELKLVGKRKRDNSPPGSCHLKRQRAVRRKVKHTANCEANDRINSKLQNSNVISVPSPTTPSYDIEATYIRKTFDEIAQIETPKLQMVNCSSLSLYPASQNENKSILSTNFSKLSNDITPDMRGINMQASSTPTGDDNFIRKCLTFSPTTNDDTISKRGSVASCKSTFGSTRNISVKGSIDLALYMDKQKIYIHALRCKDLQRLTGSTINAYVKVALLPQPNKITAYQRTAVHRDTRRPFFNHKFVFDLNEEYERIQLTVWHRDRKCKRSEFLGCVLFPITNITKKEINGSFKLQPQSCLTTPINSVLSIQNEKEQQPITMYDFSQESCEDIINLDDDGNTSSGTPDQIALSKKALHQRDADENLFLRFLELDPPIENNPQRRQSASLNYKSSNGRTPFTITKKLNKTIDKGYGMSIVWTHPPRVERVEPGLSSEKAGILPGDYIVFIDKENVVTMPEADILNLIKAQGNTLQLEIFRRPTSRQTNGLKSTLYNAAANITTHSSNANSTISAFVTNTAATLTSTSQIPTRSQSPNHQQQQHFQLQPAPQSHVYSSSSTIQQTPTHHPQLQRQPPVQVLTSNSTLAETEPEASSSTKHAQAMPPLLCSNSSLEMSKRKLNLPQVTFSKESILAINPEDHRKRILYQLINREQHFISALQFGIDRFMTPMKEKKDIISPNDHKILFQNIDELMRISEDILEQLLQEDGEPHIHFASRVYVSKTTAICAAYKKYCTGLKKADCVLVNKSRNLNSDFMKFITEPSVPRKRPDLTTFIHRPLQHFRELLKLIQLLASYCRLDTEEFNNFQTVINEIQAAYREITTTAGLMEPLCDGRPLLTLQDLEARLVFTKCKPFVLATPGRQWIFGGDLSRVEGKSVKPYWTLLFSDILLFAKVSRDRVLFITEDPIPLAHIVDSCFTVKRKGTEFRLTTDPNGRAAESPTVHCGPDITRTPRKNSKRKNIILRAPSSELKAVWQNLITRQIFLANAALGSTPLSSPLDSPDLMQTLLPYGEIGATTTSVSSIKLSMDNIHLRNQQRAIKETANVTKQIEEFIDEKCRSLNKSGTSRGGALHLAQWMKCQLEKQAIESEPIDSDPDDETNKINDWSPEEVQKRSTELKLIDENGVCQKSSVLPYCKNSKKSYDKHQIEPRTNTEPENGSTLKCFNGDHKKDESIINELFTSPPKSRSTTPDSQITVRSSPLSNKIDTISVCRNCVKKCKSRLSSSSSNSLLVHSSGSGKPSHTCNKTRKDDRKVSLVSNESSTLSSASSTITGENKTDSSFSQENSKLISSPSNSNKSNSKSNSITTLDINSNKNPEYRVKNSTPCPCKCTPKDFERKAIDTDICTHERVKIFDNINEAQKQTVILRSPIRTIDGIDADNEAPKIQETVEEDEDWSLMLIGLAQINPAVSLVNLDPFEVVPTISIVPPTPEGASNRHSNPNIWDLNKLSPDEAEERKIIVPKPTQPQSSFSDDSPDEPPYLALNTGLKRYGTMSSLERVPSEDTDEKTYNSSDEDSENDIKIVSRQYYSNTQHIKAWTSRAGAFLEESKAFIDKYLVKRELPDSVIKRQDDTLESSGAASSEDIWGTPTSGGEYDDAHNFLSAEHNQMQSPTKSSSDYSGPEDPELMMDELLMMAPPVTSSNMRGLLPRRRLEPLFEEDTESGESDDERPLNDSKAQQGQSMATKICADGANSVNEQIESDSSQKSTSLEYSTRTDLSSIQRQQQKYQVPLQSVVRAAKALTTMHHDQNRTFGNVADKYYASAQIIQETKITNCTETTESSAETFNAVQPHQPVVNPELSQAPLQSPMQQPYPHHLSPRLEMRLAMNQDILYEEDLMNYDPGPSLTSILGHDLSSYRRMRGKDIIMNRIINTSSNNSINLCRSNVEHTSFYQQNNSKIDTPILNRRKSNQRIWNSSGYVERDESALSDLERLARREKIYCMTQLQNSQLQTRGMILQTDITTSQTTPQIAKRPNKLRNSEQHLSLRNSDRQTYEDLNEYEIHTDYSSSASQQSISPKKELNRPLLDRRFWKQINRRKQTLSLDIRKE